MTAEADLIQRSSQLLGVPVKAAGTFSAGSAIAASIAGGAAGAAIGDAAADGVVGELAGGLVAGASAVAGMHAAREVAAAAEGLTPVVLVAVTDDRCVIMDWDGDSGSGTGPTRTLFSFDLASSTITYGEIGVNRKVTLHDDHNTVSFTGALGLLSSGKEGKRDVLKALGHPNA
jgi:hypothetical protein